MRGCCCGVSAGKTPITAECCAACSRLTQAGCSRINDWGNNLTTSGLPCDGEIQPRGPRGLLRSQVWKPQHRLGRRLGPTCCSGQWHWLCVMLLEWLCATLKCPGGCRAIGVPRVGRDACKELLWQLVGCSPLCLGAGSHHSRQDRPFPRLWELKRCYFLLPSLSGLL